MIRSLIGVEREVAEKYLSDNGRDFSVQVVRDRKMTKHNVELVIRVDEADGRVHIVCAEFLL